MRPRWLIIAACALGACAPTLPDNGAGVGFQDYDSYAQRNRAIPPAAGTGSVAAPPPPATGFDAARTAAAIDRAEGVAPASPATSATAAPSGPIDITAAGAPGTGGATGTAISDENDFDAVSSRETIESDAARIARNRAQYVVVAPEALPQRPGDTGPNIVAYALATTHAPGVQMYDRSGLFRKDGTAACAKYASPDLAQQDFLARGGPDKDRLGLDPDGDGFACDWDPRPFRTALQ